MERNYLDVVGQFDGVVEAPEAGWFAEAGKNDTPYIRIPVRVTDKKHKGELAIWKGWLTEDALKSTIGTLQEAFNFNGDLQALQDGKTTFVGQACSITTRKEKYEGEWRIKVAWLNKVGQGARGMDASKVAKLLAKLTPAAKKIAGAK